MGRKQKLRPATKRGLANEGNMRPRQLFIAWWDRQIQRLENVLRIWTAQEPF